MSFLTWDKNINGKENRNENIVAHVNPVHQLISLKIYLYVTASIAKIIVHNNIQ